MTNAPGVLWRHVGRVDTALVRLLAVLGALAVLRGALSPWSFNTVGIEHPGYRVGTVLAVGGVRGGIPAWQEVARSLGSQLWFAGFVWTAAGALLLVVAGVVSAAVVLRNWTGERGESAGERDPAREGE